MEDLYQRFIGGEEVGTDKESDPFWDPIEVIHLGSAHIWLQSLAYCMKLEEQTELLNSEGKEEAILLINIIPCSSSGKYRVYDLPCTVNTKPAWKNVNPRVEDKLQFTAPNASHEFLNYLQKNALVVDLWGLQDGCTELDWSLKDIKLTTEGHIVIDGIKPFPSNSHILDANNYLSELYLKLLKLEQETELLRDINRALRGENLFLKESQKKTDREPQEGYAKSALPSTNAASAKKGPHTAPSSRENMQVCNSRTSYDADFAKALKAFYQSMNTIRGHFLRLRHCRPPEEESLYLLRLFTEKQSHMFTDFWQQLESCIFKLKNDVAVIVKKKRESMAFSKP